MSIITNRKKIQGRKGVSFMALENQGLQLVVHEESFEGYQFVGVPFEVPISLTLESASDERYLGDAEIPLSIKLCYDSVSNNGLANGAEECPESVMTLLDEHGKKLKGHPVIGRTGEGTLHIVFNELSCHHQNRKFRILVSIRDGGEGGSSLSSFVKPAVIKPMQCVNYKLCIDEKEEMPYIWFKDEGGRDKTIELKITLRDSHGNVVTDRKVKLRGDLCYYGGALVDDQNLLQFSAASTFCINDDSTKKKDPVAKLMYRITQVSARHQAKPFTLKICPDTKSCPGNADIAPVFSVPVEVKSKRNTQKKEAEAGAGKRTRDGGAAGKHARGGAAPAGVDALMGGAAEAKRMRGEDVNGMSMGNGLSTASLPTGCSPADTHAHAVNNTVAWANDVIAALHEMQWKVLGYAADGGQPLYHIPNPVDRINGLMNNYPLSALNALVDSANNFDSAYIGGAASSSMPHATSASAASVPAHTSSRAGSGGMMRMSSSGNNAAIRRDDSTGNYYDNVFPPKGDGSEDDDDDDEEVDDFKTSAANAAPVGRANSLQINVLQPMGMGRNYSAMAGSSMGNIGNPMYCPRVEGVTEKPSDLATVLARVYVLRATASTAADDLSDIQSSSSGSQGAANMSINSTSRLECVPDGGVRPAESLGCPCFSPSKKLLGFLRDDMETTSGTTSIKFIDVKKAGLNPAEVYSLENELRTTRPQDERLFSTANFAAGSRPAQELMIEAALKCLWSHMSSGSGGIMVSRDFSIGGLDFGRGISSLGGMLGGPQ